MKSLTYEDIIKYLDERGEEYCILTSKEEFEHSKKEQQKSSLYVKLEFSCIKCHKTIYKSFACIKASANVCMCKSCAQIIASEPLRIDYDEAIKKIEEKGFIPLFEAKDIASVKDIKWCYGKCGHIVTTSIEAFMRSVTGLCSECCKDFHKGEKAYNWKGGYTDQKIAFRKTYAFKNFVKQVLKRDNYCCQICGKTNKQAKLIVHHKNGYNWCVEQRTDINNGITLCEDCHNAFHNLYGCGDNTLEQFEEFCTK